MLTKRGHRELAWNGLLEEVGFALAGQLLFVDFALQFHESMEQRLRPRWTARDVNVDRNITIDSFQDVVALFEGTTGDRAGTHGNDVLRVGHLVVEPDNLRRHFLCDGAGHDHKVSLARRRAKD